MKYTHETLTILVTLLVLSLYGCDSNPLARISTLEKTAEEQSAYIEELKGKLLEVESQLFALEMQKDQYLDAVFDPAADEGFHRIDTSVGTLAVSIDEVKPQADGVRVYLRVGNLTSATISGGVIKAQWGPRMPKTNTSNFAAGFNEWREKVQEMESKFTKQLEPGTWNYLTITLPGIPHEQFGHLKLSFDLTRISLFTAK